MDPSPQFVDSVEAGLDYWRRATHGLEDEAISGLVRERRNLYRAVLFGLALPQTFGLTAGNRLTIAPTDSTANVLARLDSSDETAAGALSARGAARPLRPGTSPGTPLPIEQAAVRGYGTTPYGRVGGRQTQ